MESSPTPTAKVKACTHRLINQPLSWLMAGQAVAAVAGLAYGKLTAIYISPGELGMYNLFYAGMMFLYTLLISPTIQSFKASLSRHTVAQAVRSHGGLLLSLYALALALLTVLTFAKGWSNLVYIIWLTAVGQGAYALGNDYLNIKGYYKAFAGIQVGYPLLNILLFLGLCVAMGWRTAGALWCSLAIVNVVLATLSIRHLWRAASNGSTQSLSIFWLIDQNHLRTIWHYAMPLTVMAFWSWLINYADRYIIRYYENDKAVGLYTMGYSLGSKLVLVAAPFVTYLTGLAIRQKAAGESIDTFQTRQTRYTLLYVGFASLLCLLFYVYRQRLGLIFMSPQYEQAFLIGPLIAISYLFLTIIHLLEIKWYVYRTTQYIVWHNVFGAVCNLCLNSWLIPIYGVYGAAYAMICSTLCQLCFAASLNTFLTNYKHDV